ncbi:MAG: GDSL-type esterase/lipase family protein [Candidatus Aminicenantes bacterium]|nr:GDSL-type esterase/lipase family protein [Candidatus Aminicenantes bacterium]
MKVFIRPKFFMIFLLLFFFFLFPDSTKRLETLTNNSFKPSGNQIKTEGAKKLEKILAQLKEDDEINVKTDLQGQIWCLQRTRDNGFLLKNLNSELSYFFEVKSNLSAIHSYDFAFDLFNEPWLVWIESDTSDKLWLKAFAFDQPIIIDNGPLFTLTSPSISRDINGTIWIFWAKSVQGLDRIFFTRFSHFNGLNLSRPQSLFVHQNYPCLMPSSQVDSFGRLWLTWSAYDGFDYDIFVSNYDGQSWTSPHRLSWSSQADLFPHFYSAQDGSLGLAWLEIGQKSSTLWHTKKRSGLWSEPEIIWNSSELILDYELIDQEDLILFLKKERNYYLYFHQKKSNQKERLAKNEALNLNVPFFSSGRNDDSYIAFGDSITSGMIIINLNPEIYYYNGYSHRLEEKLKQDYGIGRVINEGFDGELTAQGVSRLPQVLNYYDARYLLLMEGFNDVIFPNISLDTIIFNLQTMISQAFQKGVFTFLATITPRRDYVWSLSLYRQRHLSLVERIRQLAPQLKVPLVDQYAAMENFPASEGGLLSLFSVDLKHPNEKGYQVIAETWFKEIQAFPFPPRNLKIVRRDFVWDVKFIRLLTAPNLFSLQETGIGNLISWEINPKIKNLTKISGFRLYRKKVGESDSAYSLIATVNEYLHYLDKNVILNLQYSYLVSTYRTDGVEGPVAGPVIH